MSQLQANECGMAADGRAFERQEQVRHRKMWTWLSSPQTRSILLVWLSVSGPLMGLHYYLFKHGPHRLDQDAPGAFFSLCLLHQSRAVQLFSLLARSFSTQASAYHEVWRLALAFLGEKSLWSPELVEAAEGHILHTMGQLFSRFILRLHGWPYRLAGLLDDKATMAEKRQLATEFFHARTCCLDQGFSLRLRKLLIHPEQLLQPWLLRFLRAVFHRGLASTTYLENSFAHARQFLAKSWRAPSMHTLVQSHLIQSMKRIHGSYLQSAKRTRRNMKTRANARPVWTHRKQRRGVSLKVSSFTLYSAERAKQLWATAPAGGRRAAFVRQVLARVAQDWKELPTDQKQAYKRRAQAERDRRRQLADPLQTWIEDAQRVQPINNSSKPWGMADDEFPIAEEWVSVKLAEHRNKAKGQSFVACMAAEMKQEHSAPVAADGDMGRVPLQEPCAAK